ncbi:MAG: hypothetical protein WCE68_15125 [Anaerolineales bacterium]
MRTFSLACGVGEKVTQKNGHSGGLAQIPGSPDGIQQGLIQVERIALLGIVAGADVGAELDLACIRDFHSQDEPQ